MKFILLVGRILYAHIFFLTITTHFSAESIHYGASKQVPAADILVPLSGIIAFLGSLSIIVGLKARWGALLIIIFLLPVTFMMHDFWNETEAMQKQTQMIMFMKNISMLGAAMIISYFGPGPISVDEWIKRRRNEES
jgi:putative oxidoreductase